MAYFKDVKSNTVYCPNCTKAFGVFYGISLFDNDDHECPHCHRYIKCIDGKIAPSETDRLTDKWVDDQLNLMK